MVALRNCCRGEWLGGRRPGEVVRLHDGREFEAKDVKTDRRTDLAVVRIQGAGVVPAAQLGDSEALQVGDWVLAVGNPQCLTSRCPRALSR